MQLNFKSFGIGQPLIILHGAFGSLDNWQSIANHLASTFRVFIIDQRNHGKSPHTEEHTFPLLAEDICEFIQQQDIHSTHLIGHSMGGKVAMLFASKYPHLVNKLIVVDSTPTALSANIPSHEILFNVIKRIASAKYSDRQIAENEIATIVGEEKIKLFLFKNLKRNDKGIITWKFNAATLLKDWSKNLEEINIPSPINTPTLFIRAPGSGYINDYDLEVIADRFTNHKIIDFPGSSHWIHADEPERFKEVVLEFLQNEQLVINN